MCFDHTHTSVGAGRLLTCPVSCWHIHDWLVAGVRCRTAEPPDGQVLLFAGELHLGGVCHLRTHLQAGSRHHVLEENENLRWARSQWGTTERNAWKIALKSKITLKSNSICNQKKKRTQWKLITKSSHFLWLYSWYMTDSWIGKSQRSWCNFFNTIKHTNWSIILIFAYQRLTKTWFKLKVKTISDRRTQKLNGFTV